MKNIERIDDSTVKIDGVVYAKQTEREFKDREWVIYDGDQYPNDLPAGSIGRYNTDKSYPRNAWMREHNGSDFPHGICVLKSELRPATDKEIEAHLIAEAEKRGFKKGTRYRYPSGQRDIRIIETPSFKYHPFIDTLQIHGIEPSYADILYEDGNWAEIIKAEFPKTREELFSFLLDYNDPNMYISDFLTSRGF